MSAAGPLLRGIFLRRLGLALLALGLFAPAPTLRAWDDSPAWLQPLLGLQPSVSTTGADAVVLLDDCFIEVDPDGTFTTRNRFVVRILQKDGAAHARARLAYNASGEKVKSFRAWWINARGQTTALGKKDLVEIASYSGALELYGEAREQFLSAKDRAEVGGVFAYETIVEEKSWFNQQRWTHRGRLPVERARFSVSLPPGWRLEARTFNGDTPTPQVGGNTHAWNFPPSAALPDEPASPPSSAIVPLLAVDLLPPAKSSSSTMRALGDWPDIGRFLSPHYDRAATADPAITAKAASLVAGLTTPEARLRALCAFVQKVNYISINMNIWRAGGLIPRPSAQVLRCNYGDCKDKSTLLVALLRSQGFEAYPVAVYAGDATSVRAEWPSPLQFNHCILAIRVPAEITGFAVTDTPQLGRVLYFDPTAEDTPWGFLPGSLYGSQGLILAGAQSGLHPLPPRPAQPSRYQRHVTAEIFPLGAIRGRAVETFAGLAAENARDERGDATATEFQQIINRWLSRSLAAVEVKALTATDDFGANRFTLDMSFEAVNFGRAMRDVLLVVKPAFMPRRGFPKLAAEKRELPVVIRDDHFEETVELTPPPGFVVDEKPEPVELTTDFGHYRASTRVEGNKIIYTREFALKPTQIPAGEYQRVQEFFEAIQTAEQSPVVFARQ